MTKHAIALSVSFLLLLTNLSAQENACNCLHNVDTLIAKTEQNYAGYPAKVNKATAAAYASLKQKLRRSAAPVQNAKECFYLLKTYVRFFNDKHFILSYDNDKDYDNEIIANAATLFGNTGTANKLMPIEGIWVNADSSLKIAIKKFATQYKAVVIASKDETVPVGLVYFTFTPAGKGYKVKTYNSFITTDVPAKQIGNLLRIWNMHLFAKIYPGTLTGDEQEELNTWRNNNNGLYFKKLSAKTAYLKIPTFVNNDGNIQQLVSENDSLIRSCENLIVDLTGNGGGNTGWVSFLPYFITNPVQQYNTFLRVTPENVKLKLADLEPFAANPIPAEYKKYFPDEVLTAYIKAYRELPTTKELFYPVPGVTFPVDSVLQHPRQIALLVDDFCGSSTEYFFSLSKQSKKTTSYGVPTIGMMDYEGMSTPTALPYNKYILTIPIVRSSWTATNPIDLKGFTPDKLLHSIDQKEWVEYVRKDLEKK